MRAMPTLFLGIGLMLPSMGCTVHVHDEPVATEVVYDEPPPSERVYIYEPGYPPGCYVWNGYIFYGHRRYERDVFVDRVVVRNVHENRYVNVDENRHNGERVEERHRDTYSRAHPEWHNTAHPNMNQPEHEHEHEHHD